MAVKASRMKYEQWKKEPKREINAKGEQILIINKEIADMKVKLDSLEKINENLDKEFGMFVYEADFNPERAFFQISKATALKRYAMTIKMTWKSLKNILKLVKKWYLA